MAPWLNPAALSARKEKPGFMPGLFYPHCCCNRQFTNLAATVMVSGGKGNLNIHASAR